MCYLYRSSTFHLVLIVSCFMAFIYRTVDWRVNGPVNETLIIICPFDLRSDYNSNS